MEFGSILALKICSDISMRRSYKNKNNKINKKHRKVASSSYPLRSSSSTRVYDLYYMAGGL